MQFQYPLIYIVLPVVYWNLLIGIDNDDISHVKVFKLGVVMVAKGFKIMPLI